MESSEEVNRPYSKIAPLYDILMEDVEYERWVDYVCQLLVRTRTEGNCLLDIACGTGTTTLLFAEKGFQTKGIDNSGTMLDVAREKARKKELQVEFIEQDMRFLNMDCKFDIVTCLFDSLNYLLREEDLEKTARCVFNVLREKGGIFLFDVNTEYAFSSLDKLYVRENGDCVSIWRNVYDRKRMVDTLEITIFTKEGEFYRRLDEKHEERAWSEKTLRSIFSKVGFCRTTFYKHLTFLPADSETNRIMGIAEK